MANQTLSRVTPVSITKRATGQRSRLRWIGPLIGVTVVLVWQLTVPADGATALLLPRPSQIAARFIDVLLNGTLLRELLVTALEIAAGFALGVSAAFALGYSIAHSRALEQIAGPYIVGFQALPIVAIAPALILWLGPGLASNSLICAFIVFFPMLMSTVVGIKNIAPEYHELMSTFAATRRQTFVRLELPGALPVLFGGLKISVILSVAGAVVAESVTPLGGIGSLLYAARSRYDSALAFVAVLTLTLFALGLYGAVGRFERHWLGWKQNR
jgi:NitT/TauT family transport system permease protein